MLVLLSEMEQTLTQWPEGHFSLPESWDRCPPGAEELDSYIYQDNEDDNNMNAESPGNRLLLFQDRDYTDLSYCNFPSNANGGSWPNGSYCLVKRSAQPCPDGFEEGSLFWDDENDDNDNYIYGIVPDGTFDSNTLIKYCCRSDGDIATPIPLPNTAPFVMLRQSAGGCQQVQGMNVADAWVFTDDENDCNLNRKSGSTPYVEGVRDFRVYYCYYTRQ